MEKKNNNNFGRPEWTAPSSQLETILSLSLSLIYRNVMLRVCAVGRERQSTEQNAFFIFLAVERKGNGAIDANQSAGNTRDPRPYNSLSFLKV